nr:tetratricopeptide repeat protein [Spirochaetota bacterium]
MRNKIIFAFLIIFSTLFFIFAFLLNARMISTRFLELSTLFFSINDEESGRDYLNLVATYGLHKKLYENVIDENNFSLEELKTSLILSENRKKFDKNINFLNFPALSIINGLRFLIGKPKIEKIIDSDFNDDLDLAYFFERQKQYKRSLALYDEILKKIKNDNKRKAIILLHEGYCYSIMGEYARAKEKYIEVINIDKNTSMAITA